jgi:hypothetical protein
MLSPYANKGLFFPQEIAYDNLTYGKLFESKGSSQEMNFHTPHVGLLRRAD